MKNPFDGWEVGVAQWPREGTDGKGEQFNPRGCQDPPVTSTSCKCVQAESLEDPAGLNVEILVSYVSAYNL